MTSKDGPAEAEAFEQRFPGGSESANAAIRALVQAHEDTSRLANHALRHYGLSPSARQALAAIDGAGGTLPQSAIATQLLSAPASITSLLDTLERRGLVVRERDPEDRRKQSVRITEAGSAAVRQFVPEAVAIQTAILAGFTDAERGRLTRMLLRVSEAAAQLDGDEILAQQPPRNTYAPVPDLVAGREAPR
jgi:DNA-binding MarR family transcriptional regulator